MGEVIGYMFSLGSMRKNCIRLLETMQYLYNNSVNSHNEPFYSICRFVLVLVLGVNMTRSCRKMNWEKISEIRQ